MEILALLISKLSLQTSAIIFGTLIRIDVPVLHVKSQNYTVMHLNTPTPLSFPGEEKKLRELSPFMSGLGK